MIGNTVFEPDETFQVQLIGAIGAGFGTATTATLTIKNDDAPALALTVAPSQNATEGTAKTFNLGSFSGGTGPYTVTVNWGDGTAATTFSASPGALSAAHTYANDRSTPYAVTVTVTDSAGGSATGSSSATVANAPPTVKITSPSGGSAFKPGVTVSFSASFTDPGKSDTHTCTVTWGDGSTSTGTISESGGAGTCTASHAFATTASYSLTVTVKDNANASASATSSVSVTKNGSGTGTVAFAFAATTVAADAAPTLIRSKLSRAALAFVRRIAWPFRAAWLAGVPRLRTAR